MTRDELLAKLKWLANNDRHDPEMDHMEADEAILNLIDDAEITEAFKEIRKWYA